MFDLNSTDGSVRKKKFKSPIPDMAAPEPLTPNQLDREDMVALHRQLLGYYKRELDRSALNRAEQAQEENFYDNIQWDEADAQILRERGQVPLVYNVVSASVDWVTGTEKRARTDYRILPRRKQEAKAAQRKTELMKYLADVNRTNFDISRVFEDSVKVGIGWLEDGVDFNTDTEPLYTRYESWRNIVWDTAANELDLSDARYLFRAKWLDMDIAEAMFPKRKDLLRRASSRSDGLMTGDVYGDDAMDEREIEAMNEIIGYGGSGDLDNGGNRPRVRLIEGWIQMPAEINRIQGGAFNGEIYDDLSPAHKAAIESGESTLAARTTMVMHVAIFTTTGLLWFSKSPYRHNRFPFTPVWAYRRGFDGMPYGMIRRLKDIQQDINKRASKALHILSTNKIIMDDGAVDDVNELLEEVARPDAVIVKKAGKELTINAERDLAPAHLDLMSRGIAMVQQASGVTDELMGRRTNAVSGIAIQSRQEQGSMVTAKLFDNLMLFAQVRGEKQLSLIEQFMSDQKQFRITNQRGQPEYIEINDGLPANDITRSKADFLISEADWQVTLRQSAANQLMDMATKMPPEIMMTLLDLIVENMDIVNADEIVKRIRSITGQRDPDADPEQMTPEEQKRMQAAAAQQQMQQQQMAMQMEAIAAETAKKQADAQRAIAQAQQYQANTVRSNINAQENALSTAAMAIQAPVVVDTADAILREAGFVSRSEAEEQQEAEAMANEQAKLQAQQQQMHQQEQSEPTQQPVDDAAQELSGNAYPEIQQDQTIPVQGEPA